MLSYSSLNTPCLDIYPLFLGRFRLVQKTGQACTALAFSLRRTTEFLVALADYTIKCFDKGETDIRLYSLRRINLIILRFQQQNRLDAKTNRHLLTAVILLFFCLHRHKAARQLDARSRGRHFFHLRPQLRPIRHHYIIRHCSTVGPGHVPEEEEAEHQTVCRHTEG